MYTLMKEAKINRTLVIMRNKLKAKLIGKKIELNKNNAHKDLLNLDEKQVFFKTLIFGIYPNDPVVSFRSWYKILNEMIQKWWPKSETN